MIYNNISNVIDYQARGLDIFFTIIYQFPLVIDSRVIPSQGVYTTIVC